MDEMPSRPYDAPTIDPGQVRVCDRVEVRAGIGFTIVTGQEASDPISHDLASGVYPESYYPLIGLLEALVPPGGRVLDLGTHLGTFSLAAAALGYEVLGVEASPRNAALLGASVARNRFGRMRLVHAAVSDRPGALEFHQAGPYGHVCTSGMGLPTVSVPAVVVDDLLAEHGWDRVDFIKMDIEGSEVAGLRGMARLLSKPDAPPLVVESNGHTLGLFGQEPGDLKRALEALGYRNYLVEPGRLSPVGAGEPQPSMYVDYLALKRPPRQLRGWRIDPPLGPEEFTARALETCRSVTIIDRRYIARTLARADKSIRSRPPLADALRSLCDDPDAQVRAAARLLPLAPERRLWFWPWRS